MWKDDRRLAVKAVALALGALIVASTAATFADVTPARPAPGAASSATKPASSAAVPGASAAPADGALPPGHPSLDGDSNPDSDPDPDDAANVPPGHPSMEAGNPPATRVSPAVELPPGTIEVLLRDEANRPVANAPLKLGILRQEVATGDSHEDRGAITDASGEVRFQDLQRSSSYSYRIMSERGAATYASESFRLDETAGRRVVLQVYPVVRDIRQALVGMRGVLFVQPREDVFQFEASFQVLNVGQITWVPDDVRMPLPDGAKAFRANESQNDTRVDRKGTGDLELLGTYSPGQHDVGYTFQVDNKHDAARSFRVALPPHVAELRIVAEAGKETTLHVDGFPDAEPMQGQDGSRLLVTGKQLMRGEPALATVTINLDGLPVPSSGRWYAVAIAAALFVGGLFWARVAPETESSKSERSADLTQAIDLILDELMILERLHRESRIGPRTYSEARVALLDALGRLGFRYARTPATAK
jgi:hypothetical protein